MNLGKLGARGGFGSLGVLGKAGNPGVTPFWLASASHGDLPNIQANASTGNRLCLESRSRHVIGNKPLDAIKLSFVGYYVTGGNFEQGNGNTQTIEVALEIGGTTVQFLFGGAQVGALLSGATLYETDPIYPAQFSLSSFAANTVCWVRSRRTVTSAQNFNCGQGSTTTGEAGFFSDGASPSQLLGTGAMSIQTGGATTVFINNPVVFAGLAASHDIAVIGIGDSIMAGLNDTLGDGSTSSGGWFARGLNSVSGRTVPWLRAATAGTRVDQALTGFVKRKPLLAYFTHALVSYGTNDMVSTGGNRSAAQAGADLQSFVTLLRAAVGNSLRRVECVLCIPRTASTDSWATAINQTPVANFESGGTKRDPFNVSLAGLAPGIDAILDLNSAFEDGSNLGKWQSPSKTTDGTHPQPAPSGVAAGLLTTRAATWV